MMNETLNSPIRLIILKEELIMKNKWRILCVSAALALVLSACGSTVTEDKELEKEDAPVVQDKDIEKVEGVNEPEEEDEEVKNDESTENDSVNTEAKDETVSNNTTDLKNEATLVDSDAQDFSMYVLPGYKLTSEEPGRDSLYSESDESFFMRIETMPKEEGTYDYLAENMLTLLDATSDGDAPVELSEASTLPSGDGITNVKAYSVKAETGPVTGILFERGDLIVRLTIFDSPEAKYFKDSLQMGETVIAN